MRRQPVLAVYIVVLDGASRTPAGLFLRVLAMFDLVSDDRMKREDFGEVVRLTGFPQIFLSGYHLPGPIIDMVITYTN